MTQDGARKGNGMADALPELHTAQRGPVLWLTLDRPARRNALTPGLLAALGQAIAAAQTQPGVRAIVLTGAGEQAFCSGMDLQAGPAFRADQPHGHLAQLLRCAHASQLPLVARVNGACMAGGMGLLAMCDLAVACPQAQFGLPEVKLGLFPAQVLSVLQPLIPRRTLVEMCLTGSPISAARALDIGLLNAVDADLDGCLDALLQRLLAASPAATRRGLYTLKTVADLAFDPAVAFTESQIALLALGDDAQEGQAAFREKRPPRWGS
jgi:enoyl-CoA hydratase/carnithine racemase